MDEVVFGRYRLRSLIGQGAMGKVYKAHDSVMGRDVAIKVLPPELATQPGYEERFRREAYTAARLTEPHIIPIHEAGEIDGRLYLVMPVINGTDLDSLLQRDGPMSPQRATRVIEQLAAALDTAHEAGLVHRDVKPSNALVARHDFVYLIDFGIAHHTAATRLTSTGLIVGTWAYMSPERFTAGTTDARSDVYALACVLYECLTGVTPYPGDSLERQFAGHCSLDPPKPTDLNPAIPAGLNEVIARGMAKKPDQRYQSAGELATAAQHALTELPTPARYLHRAPIAPGDPTLVDTPPPQQLRKSATTRQLIPRDKLGPRTKIAQGGQGVVYRAPNVKTKFAASMVYKEYKTQARTEIDFTALAAMPALVEESLTYSQAERLISIAAWPCAIVENAGTPTGFVMPAIPDEFSIPLTTAKGVSNSTAEFQHLLNHPTVLAARGLNLDDAQRCTLLRETASALAFLHKHGVCVGDISPKNLLFSVTPRAAVYFIDCDAMRINTVSALPQVETPGWNAPPGEELATIYTDTYKLGLLALRLLTGDHDTANPQHLPLTTPTQLRQIITDTLTNPPQQRPLPEAWTSVLSHSIAQAPHQFKRTSAAAAAPVSAPAAPPAIPTVRSRPPVQSSPPMRPSAPPPSAPPPAWAPPPSAPPPAWAPPPTQPRKSQTKIWTGVGLAAAVVAVLVAVALVKIKNGTPSSAPETSTATRTSALPTSYPTSYPTATPPHTPTASRPPSITFATPPNVLQGADGAGDSGCNGGYPLNGTVRVAPAAPSGPGPYTSCGFAKAVGQSYINTNPDYISPKRITVTSPKANCVDVQANHPNVQCAGTDFVMQCHMEGSYQAMWVICQGGNDAVVYIY